ncbi:MAG: hypothetical protein K2H48_05025, partial [Duncaniella sp.]|nr:hypothetical protein [Duncaniella sp.]
PKSDNRVFLNKKCQNRLDFSIEYAFCNYVSPPSPQTLTRGLCRRLAYRKDKQISSNANYQPKILTKKLKRK